MQSFGALWTLASLGTALAAMYPLYFVEDKCRFGDEQISYEIGGTQVSSIILNATKHPPYSSFRNCTIELQPHFRLSDGIILSVMNVVFQSSSTKECTDYIQIYSANGPLSRRLCDFHMDAYGLDSYSTSGSMYLKYHTGSRTSDYKTLTGFAAVATSYSKMPCNSDEFQCRNERCIWKGLTCDGMNNCGDRSDERHPTCFGIVRRPDFTDFYIILFSTCVVIVLIAVSAVIFWYVRRKRSCSEVYADNLLSPYSGIDRPPPYTITADPLVDSQRPTREPPPPYEP